MSIESSFSELRSEDFLFLETGGPPRASDPDGDGDGDGGGDGGSGGSDDDWDPDSPLPIPWPPEDLTSEALPDYVMLEIDQIVLAGGKGTRASDPDGDGDGDGGGDGGSGGSDDDWDPDSPLPIPWPPEDLTSEALPDYVRSDIDQIWIGDEFGPYLIRTNLDGTGDTSRAGAPDGDGDDDSGGSGGSGGSDDDWDPDSPWPMPNPPEAKTSEGTPDFARTDPDSYIFDTAIPAEADHGLDGCWDDRPIRDDNNSGEPEPEPVDRTQSSVLEYAEYDMTIL